MIPDLSPPNDPHRIPIFIKMKTFKKKFHAQLLHASVAYSIRLIPTRLKIRRARWNAEEIKWAEYATQVVISNR